MKNIFAFLIFNGIGCASNKTERCSLVPVSIQTWLPSSNLYKSKIIRQDNKVGGNIFFKRLEHLTLGSLNCPFFAEREDISDCFTHCHLGSEIFCAIKVSEFDIFCTQNIPMRVLREAITLLGPEYELISNMNGHGYFNGHSAIIYFKKNIDIIHYLSYNSTFDITGECVFQGNETVSAKKACTKRKEVKADAIIAQFKSNYDRNVIEIFNVNLISENDVKDRPRIMAVDEILRKRFELPKTKGNYTRVVMGNFGIDHKCFNNSALYNYLLGGLRKHNETESNPDGLLLQQVDSHSRGVLMTELVVKEENVLEKAVKSYIFYTFDYCADVMFLSIKKNDLEFRSKNNINNVGVVLCFYNIPITRMDFNELLNTIGN